MYETATQKFARGEIWYVSSEPLQPGVTAMGRYVAILTSDYGCKVGLSLLCVPLTTQLNGQNKSVNTLIESGERSRVALGSQVTPIPKNMFRRKDGVLTATELEQVEMGVLIAMGITERGQKPEDKNTELVLERDLYKRLYEKALEQLTELRFERDGQPESEPEIEECPEPLYLEEAEIRDHPVDLSKPEPKIKKKKHGAPGMKTGKQTVNVNKATWFDLKAKLNLGEQTAKEIIARRNKLGRFTCEEEIACLPRMGKRNLEKIEGRIVFEDADFV